MFTFRLKRLNAKENLGSKGFYIFSALSSNYACLTRLSGSPPMKLSLVFCIFSIANFLAAYYTPIHDCDETFNYWEPLHYLTHGYGLQTWEYSPEYAIRSWFYIGIHALIGNMRGLLPRASKVSEFYFIRCVLALTCSLCQTLMFRVIGNTLNLRIAYFFLISMVTSPGMFHASVSFLPSSFSMFTAMLGISAFMDSKKSNIIQGISWFSTGGIIGWPFSIVLCAPFLIGEIFVACRSNKKAVIQILARVKKGIGVSILLLISESLISGLFYKRFVIVPLNIILYNIVSGPGPNLYGTEPWNYYIRNLLLNFNLWLILAVFSLPLFITKKTISRKNYMASDLQYIIILSPFYIWLLIFSLQPHKEERFMYPVYPCLALNASISLHMIIIALQNYNCNIVSGSVAHYSKVLMLTLLFISSVGLGLARTYGVYTAYSAPLHIYNALTTNESDKYICFGKDWYRFPSSYHIPDNMRAKFIKSEFNGLLPGEFFEGGSEYGTWSGTWRKPPGMNNQNIEDSGKHTDILACNFLVDTYFPGIKSSLLEPNYFLESTNWEIVRCAPLLHTSQSAPLGRMLWIPKLPEFAPEKFHKLWNKVTSRKWGEHCLMKRRRDK